MRPVFLAVAAGFLLSGCLNSLENPSGYDSNPANFNVTAHDVGFFAAVQNATPAGWMRTTGGGGGLPPNATLDRLWGGYSLSNVGGPDTGLPSPPWPPWEWPAAHVYFKVDGSTDGAEGPVVELALVDGVPNDVVALWAERFLENVTTMDAQARHDWAARFAATNVRYAVYGPKDEADVHEYQLGLEGHLALASLWNRLQPQPDAQGGARASGWSFEFLTGPIMLARGGTRLYVAQDDTVRFHGDWQRGINETRALADFHASYISLGRAVPGDAKFRYAGPIH